MMNFILITCLHVNKVPNISCLVIWDSKAQCALFALHLFYVMQFSFAHGFLGLDSYIVVDELILVWMVGIKLGFYYVVCLSVLIMKVVSIDIGMHDSPTILQYLPSKKFHI